MKSKSLKVILGLALMAAAGSALALKIVCTGCVPDGNGGYICTECHPA